MRYGSYATQVCAAEAQDEAATDAGALSTAAAGAAVLPVDSLPTTTTDDGTALNVTKERFVLIVANNRAAADSSTSIAYPSRAYDREQYAQGNEMVPIGPIPYSLFPIHQA
jgi:hypothetical protein